MEFTSRRRLCVGPDGEHTNLKLPINSGNEGGTPGIGKNGRILEQKQGELDFVKLKALLDRELS